MALDSLLLMVTGVTDWTGAENMEVVSPLWGYTAIFILVATLMWIWWHVATFKIENREYEVAVEDWLQHGIPGYEGFEEELREAFGHGKTK
jgi:hypothetical protein